jgi:phosphoribosylformimino-5-aminoimidazole carboxamide ribotide isomerase
VRVIGVIDLRGGLAVHARAGQRDRYQPVQAVAGATIRTGDAIALARAYVERSGIDELYVADLDALAGGSPQDALVADIAAIGPRVLLDAGVASVDRARAARTLGADRVVVALETLPDFDALGDICNAIGSEHVAFSLDLRNGQPMVAAGGGISPDVAPHVVARRAKDAGADTVIVIDLARVGTGSGLDLELLALIRDASAAKGTESNRVHRGSSLLAGGGVRGFGDLARLADVGCDGALVATALHDGRIGVSEIAAAAAYRSVSR